MDYTEIVGMLIKLVLVPWLIFVSNELLKYLFAWIEDNHRVSKVIQVESIKNQAVEAVNAAIKETAKVYVDTLKDSDAFTKEAQIEAFELAFGTAKDILGPAAMDVLRKSVGDVNIYLEALIESQLKDLEEEECRDIS